MAAGINNPVRRLADVFSRTGTGMEITPGLNRQSWSDVGFGLRIHPFTIKRANAQINPPI
jgi:hypothetical protein